MIFLSAGHRPHSIKPDPGAVANGHTEANLAVDFRELVEIELNKLKKKTPNSNIIPVLIILT